MIVRMLQTERVDCEEATELAECDKSKVEDEQH